MPRTAAHALSALLAALAAIAGPPATAASKPNVIVILTDDQGYGDLSAHGNPYVRTPRLDALHSESIRFTDPVSLAFRTGQPHTPVRLSMRRNAWGHSCPRGQTSTRATALRPLADRNDGGDRRPPACSWPSPAERSRRRRCDLDRAASGAARCPREKRREAAERPTKKSADTRFVT